MSAPTPAPIERLPIAHAYLCSLDVRVGPIVTLDPGPYGERRVVDILGGRVEGPDLVGTVVPGGADWQIVRADGVVDIEAHYSLLLDDAARVEVVSTGLRYAADDALERIAGGDAVDPSEYFFRTFVRFQTGSPRLATLNRTMAVATGARRRDRVELTLYRVL